MSDNGLDWKRGIREAGRVLKPGGRFLFVESSDVDGVSYLDEVAGLSDFRLEGSTGEGSSEGGSGSSDASDVGEDELEGENEDDGESTTAKAATQPIFEEVGYDQVDMVLQPHIAGVAVKALDADLSAADKARKQSEEESDRLAELSLNAFERGNKSRRRRKKKKKGGNKGSGDDEEEQ